MAIVGAGPGIGLAIAERFGREGFRIALLSRSGDADGSLRRRLTAQGVESAAFAVDVMDRSDLERVLADVKVQIGRIDVLEYGPTPPMSAMRTTREIDVESEQVQLDVQLLGAITAVRAVLPSMLERRAGSLLFTTAASAQHPAAMTASFGVAAGALLNYVRVLHHDLVEAGIRAGLVSIAGLVVQDLGAETPPGFPPGVPKVHASDVANLHWSLHKGEAGPEQYAGDIDALLRVPGLY